MKRIFSLILLILSFAYWGWALDLPISDPVASVAESTMVVQELQFSHPTFHQAFLNEAWIQREFETYQNRKGYKAFAFMYSDDGWLATGWADDKISQRDAIREAFRLCEFYGDKHAPCEIVDLQWPQPGRSTLIEGEPAPKELIAFRDIEGFREYRKAARPKAFVISEHSGAGFWDADAKTVEEAIQRAFAICNALIHESEKQCLLLEKEG